MEALMTCSSLLLSCALLTALSSPGFRPDDDDPIFRQKKLTEWLEWLRGEKDQANRLLSLQALGCNGSISEAWVQPLGERRRAGLFAIELIGPGKSRKVMPAIIDALQKDSEDRIREAAAQALGRLLAGKGDVERIRLGDTRDALIGALRTDKAGRVREAAATALGRFTPEGEPQARYRPLDARPALPALVAALNDPYVDTSKAPVVSRAAADTLRRIGRVASDVVPELMVVLQNSKADEVTRIHLAQAIGQIGSPDAVVALTILKVVLSDAKAPLDLRVKVAEAIGQLHRDAGDLTALLGMLLAATDTDVRLRRACAVALDQFGSDARPVLPNLRKAIRDDDKFVRCMVLHIIGQMGKDLGAETKDVVTDILERLNKDRVAEVRVAAMETFGSLGLDNLGDDAKAVLNKLTELTKDSQREIREAAENTLKKLKGA
jgi:HEAT repeat protein